MDSRAAQSSGSNFYWIFWGLREWILAHNSSAGIRSLQLPPPTEPPRFIATMELDHDSHGDTWLAIFLRDLQPLPLAAHDSCATHTGAKHFPPPATRICIITHIRLEQFHPERFVLHYNGFHDALDLDRPRRYRVPLSFFLFFSELIVLAHSLFASSLYLCRSISSAHRHSRAWCSRPSDQHPRSFSCFWFFIRLLAKRMMERRPYICTL